jgi:Ala-tRNA(Pro) deacylase
MNIAPTVQKYLVAQQADYELIPHSHTESSNGTARAAHVPGARVAKAVLVKDHKGFVLAVLPANRQVALAQLGSALGRETLQLAGETELKQKFADCAPGAVPPLGSAYGLPVVLDVALAEQPEVYFEAGDHEHVVHMTRNEFQRLLPDAARASFGEPYASGGGAWMQ